jgi:TPR repeat protein
LYESAAKEEGLYAGFRLAKFYMRTGEAERAFASMVELTAKGYAPAIYQLGRMFAEGIGTPQDMEQSRYYLEYVAEHGHLWAKRYLIRLEMRSGGWLKRMRAVARLVWMGTEVYRIARDDPDDTRLIA